jgi:hypothetical protein
VSVWRKNGGIVVVRDFQRDTDACAEAIRMLLEKSRKEGGPATAPDDGTKVKEDSADAIIPEPS